ncbi:MAG: S41 family peptidase [Lentisphaeria bacterium]|nr:S41 family peptidase [Lentisphaeria bacterium]
MKRLRDLARPRSFWLLVLGGLLVVNAAIGYRVYSEEAERSGEDEAFEKVAVMMRVLYLIRKDYVNADKTSYRDLVYNALHGMVRSLDPFSDFMPPEQYDSMMESTEGEFGGLGIIVSTKDGMLTIVSPIDGTPGSRAGLQAGDQILKIDGQSTREMKLNDAVRLMRGPQGTEVNITVLRPSSGETRDYTITRERIPVLSVTDVKVFEGTRVGHVRITQFNDPTAEELTRALSSLEEQKIDSLIVDLRNNPGGLLPSAVEICSYFLEPGTLIVSTEGRQPSQKHEFRTSRKGFKFDKKPVAILVNGGSASAAEIMAGCLQDWGRAILIGEKTFGKGSVQNVIPLPDGSALRLTTAMYYTPSRRVIHEHGVEPDIHIALTRDQYQAIFEAQGNGEAASGRVPDNDPQVQRAIEVLKSYEVYLKSTKGRFRDLRQAAEGTPPEPGKAEETQAEHPAEGEP